MSTGRSIWTLFTTVATIVIVVLLIGSCDRSAHDLSQAGSQLQHAANQIQQSYEQATSAQQAAAVQAVKQRENALDGRPCKVAGLKGSIVVEGPTAGNPGRADCIANP